MSFQQKSTAHEFYSEDIQVRLKTLERSISDASDLAIYLANWDQELKDRENDLLENQSGFIKMKKEFEDEKKSLTQNGKAMQDQLEMMDKQLQDQIEMMEKKVQEHLEAKYIILADEKNRWEKKLESERKLMELKFNNKIDKMKLDCNIKEAELLAREAELGDRENQIKDKIQEEEIVISPYGRAKTKSNAGSVSGISPFSRKTPSVSNSKVFEDDDNETWVAKDAQDGGWESDC